MVLKLRITYVQSDGGARYSLWQLFRLFKLA